MKMNFPADVRKRYMVLLDKGLTVSQIAEKLGVSRATVTNTLRGRRNSEETKLRIAELLGVKVSRLFAA